MSIPQYYLTGLTSGVIRQTIYKPHAVSFPLIDSTPTPTHPAAFQAWQTIHTLSDYVWCLLGRKVH